MENVIKFVRPSDTLQNWGKVIIENVNNLEMPIEESVIATTNKNLCSSGVDLVCSSPSRPCSG